MAKHIIGDQQHVQDVKMNCLLRQFRSLFLVEGELVPIRRLPLRKRAILVIMCIIIGMLIGIASLIFKYVIYS
jgi:hypothetical protein